MRRYFFWFCVLACIALVLYDIKYNVHTAQKETRRLEAELVKERTRLQMVELEWTMLTRPERIRVLAEKHLQLQPIAPERLMLQDTAMWNASHLTNAQSSSATKPVNLTEGIIE
jgi:cell division protein FtsL